MSEINTTEQSNSSLVNDHQQNVPIEQNDEQITPERSSSQEFLDRARLIGRTVLEATGVVLSTVQVKVAEKSVKKAIDKHYDTISGDIHTGIVSKEALAGAVSLHMRSWGKNNPGASPLDTELEKNRVEDQFKKADPEKTEAIDPEKTDPKLMKGDLVSRFRDWRMHRKTEKLIKASIDYEKNRKNTGEISSTVRTFSNKVGGKASARIDFLKGEASAAEMSNRVAEAKGSIHYTVHGRVRRAERAEGRAERKIPKYAARIEKRAEKRVIRAKGRIEKKEETLEKRRKTLQERQQQANN